MFGKRSVCLLVSLLLLTSVLVACSGSAPTQGTAATAAPSGSSAQQSGAPAAQRKYEGVTLKIATADNYYAPKSYNTVMPIYEEFEKLTGIKIEWQVTSTNDYSTQMQTRLAAAIDLPDIFGMAGNADKHGIDGISIPIDGMIAEHAPYLNQLFGMMPLVKNAVTTFDGHIYAYPGFGEGILESHQNMETGVWTDPGANINLHVSAIRKDWLEKVQMETPTNADEWLKVLKAFRDTDMNGNGQANDEIPLTVTWSWQNLFRFADGWGINAQGPNSRNYSVGADGQLYYLYTAPEMKNVLEFLNTLYSEGLIDPEYQANNFEKASLKINQNLVGAVASDWMSNFPSWTNNLRKGGVTAAEFVPVRPLKNQDGEVLSFNRWSIWKQAAISKDCKNPEAALYWLDMHCLSPEGIKLQMFGVEGLSYTVAADGSLQYTDFVLNNPEGLGPFEAIRSIGGWCTSMPYIQTKDAYVAINQSNKGMLEFTASFGPESVRPPYNTSLSMMDDERERNAELQANIDTYRNEMLLKFIEGKEPLSKYDEYVKEMEKLGLPEMLKIQQTAYDRFVGN